MEILNQGFHIYSKGASAVFELKGLETNLFHKAIIKIKNGYIKSLEVVETDWLVDHRLSDNNRKTLENITIKLCKKHNVEIKE